MILEKATELFLNEGYSTTSIDKVAEVAGVTKPTVYSHFESKTGLFKAAVEANAQQRAGKLKQLLEVTNNPEEDLCRFGEHFLAVVLSQEAGCWDRVAQAEAFRHPEVGKMFYEAGPKRVLAAVAGYLEQQTANGRLSVESPSDAADLLMGMFLGVDLLRTRIGVQAPSQTQIKKKCRAAVQVFLSAFQSEDRQ